MTAEEKALRVVEGWRAPSACIRSHDVMPCIGWLYAQYIRYSTVHYVFRTGDLQTQ